MLCSFNEKVQSIVLGHSSYYIPTFQISKKSESFNRHQSELIVN